MVSRYSFFGGLTYVETSYLPLSIQTLFKTVPRLFVFFDAKRLRAPAFKQALFKVLHLNLDLIHPLLSSLYSPIGRPAIHQIEIFRSLLLMNHFGYTSISKWVDLLKSDALYAALCGFFSDSDLPHLGSYYDFMDRLYLDKDHTFIFPINRYKKPDQKVKKGEKWNNASKNQTQLLYEKSMDGAIDEDRPELILHQIFKSLSIDESSRQDLISSKDLILSGDGSSLHIHAGTRGHRIPDTDELRRYSDPDANIGWDSDKGCFYFGYTSYFLACHALKENTAFDRPLHFQLVPASQHDALTIFSVLAQFRHLNPDISVQHLCLDSAHDNSSTFQLCHDWQINPVIDLNKRNTKEKKFDDEFTLDLDGTPLCRCGERMVNWGYCKDRYRYKYRCPLKCRKIQDCPYKDRCSKSEYGRVLYIKSEELDPRYRSCIKYKTEKWNEIYKNRTSCERVNNRILNDYHLQHTFMRTKRRLYLLEMLCCINIHADAWYKFSDFDI